MSAPLTVSEKWLRALCAVSIIGMAIWLSPIETRNRIFHPGFGSCGRCHKTWDVVKGHTTYYKPSRGMFVLCEVCWFELGLPDSRIQYYWHQILANAERDPKVLEEWPALEAAIREGK